MTTHQSKGIDPVDELLARLHAHGNECFCEEDEFTPAQAKAAITQLMLRERLEGRLEVHREVADNRDRKNYLNDLYAYDLEQLKAWKAQLVEVEGKQDA